MKKLGLDHVPEQVIRLGIVAILIVGSVVLILFLLPPAMIDKPMHVQATIQHEMAKPMRFAGSGVCGDCHEEESTKKRTGYHKNLSCETCHGPSAKHTEDPTEVLPMVPRVRQACSYCHEYNLSRPTGFPQITATLHNPLQPCVECHDSHDPVPPTTPQECSACHAGIVRTKSVSSHALVECTTCHVVPEQHKITPRLVAATKPESREFCGTCHGPDSIQTTAPRVNESTHYDRYVCWQCHYPHLPAERL